MSLLSAFTKSALHLRYCTLMFICVLVSACNSETTIGDLINGVPTLSGTPADSGVVVVDYELALPAGHSFGTVYPIGNEQAYLVNIETKERFTATDQRGWTFLFSGIPEGQYHFMMASISAYLVDATDVSGKEKRHTYAFARGPVVNQAIAVAAGQVNYYGRLNIFSQPRPGFEAPSPFSDNAESVGPMDTTITKDEKRERYVWGVYAKVYANSAWAQVFAEQ